ncbi:MAG: protein YgfX, partial [Gammaproteobacteria bacterium]
MGGNAFTQPVRIRLQPSRQLFGAFCILHAGAVFLLLSASLPQLVQILLIITVIWHFYQMLRLHVLFSVSGQPREILLDSQRRWWLTNRQGDSELAELHADPLIHPWLVALRFKTGAKKPGAKK